MEIKINVTSTYVLFFLTVPKRNRHTFGHLILRTDETNNSLNLLRIYRILLGIKKYIFFTFYFNFRGQGLYNVIAATRRSSEMLFRLITAKIEQKIILTLQLIKKYFSLDGMVSQILSPNLFEENIQNYPISYSLCLYVRVNPS